MASLYGFAALTHDTAGGWSLELLPKVTLRPSSAVSLSLAPAYLTGRFPAQYVTTVSDTFAKNTFQARYVFAQLMELQLSATLHFNATCSPSVKAVWRWEYRPGSTVFLAWTHSRSNYFPYDASFNVARDFGRELFLDRPKNVLLVKFNYWLSL